MKYIVLSLTVMGLGFTGCRSSDEDVQRNGSYPDFKTGNFSKGELIVEPLTAGTPLPKGTPPVLYTVHDEHGIQVARSSTSSTTLPAGRYLVRLANPDPELKAFWVTVEPGKTTHVDLARVREGEVPPPPVD